MKQDHLGVFALFVGFFLLLVGLFHNTGFDDPYITYRYAQHVANGIGFVYNAGEYILSTTTPLYTLLLVPISCAGLPIPLVSNVIGCMSMAVGGLLFWYLGQTWRSPLAGLVGLMLYPTSYLVSMSLGGEVPLYNTLILAGFLASAKERDRTAAILLACAALIRADGVLAAGAVGISVLVSRKKFVAWYAITLYLALLVPWFAFAWLYFGSPFPITLMVKQRQGLMAISQSFFAGLMDQGRLFLNTPLLHVHLAFGLFGMVAIVIRRWHHGLLLVGWSIVYIIAYTMLGVTSYFWYYTPAMIGFVALVAIGIAAWHQLVLYQKHFRILVWALLFFMLIGQIHSLLILRTMRDSRLDTYRQVGEWINSNTPVDTSVGTLEVGIIGYYAQRKMIDFAGLMQPETALRFSRTTTYEDAAYWAVDHFHPEYVVLHDTMFSRIEQSDSFQQHCQSIQTFEDAQRRLVVYRCRW